VSHGGEASAGGRAALMVILAVHLALSSGYSLVVPLWEAPDEPAHFLYVDHMARHASLPTPAPAPTGPWYEQRQVTAPYEWYQMPLYYAVTAGPVALSRAVGGEVPPVQFPRVHRGFPLHSPRVFEAEGGAAPGARAARCVSLLLGVLGVWATHSLARSLTREDEVTAAASAGLLAFIPQFGFVSAYVTNDALVVPLAALCLRSYVGWCEGDEPPSLPRVAGGGLLVSLALLAKLSLAPLAPLGVGVLAWRGRRQGWPWVRQVALFTGAMVSLPVLAAALLPGFLDQLAHARATMRHQAQLLTLVHVTSLGPPTHASFWGRFGWMSVVSPPWVAWLFDVVVITGLVTAAAASAKVSLALRRAMFPLWSICGLAVVAFVRFNLSTSQPQGRLLYVALPALCVLAGFGLARLGGRHRAGVVAAVVSALAGVDAFCLLRVVLPAYP
jgi:hypothetical protein